MDAELKKCIEDLTEAVGKGSSWGGQTTREARDKIELVVKEVSHLRDELDKTKQEFSEKIVSLTAAIQDASASSSKLGRIMIVLTIILALSAILTAFSPYLSKLEPIQSELSTPLAPSSLTPR